MIFVTNSRKGFYTVWNNTVYYMSFNRFSANLTDLISLDELRKNDDWDIDCFEKASIEEFMNQEEMEIQHYTFDEWIEKVRKGL